MNSNPVTENSNTSTGFAAPSAEQEGCGFSEMPAPVKEHEWLQRFVGDWEAEIEAAMEPGQPPMRTEGVEQARMLGGFWMISEGRNKSFPYAFTLTLGYDQRRKKYVGTWVDTMCGHLWLYEGALDATGSVLTLETEGPCPMNPGQVFKCREVTEFVSKDHRIFTSSRLGADGAWATLCTIHSRRKK
ncbi:MAG: DUF1579 domain-containing protein [Opitutaceae bacterium]